MLILKYINVSYCVNKKQFVFANSIKNFRYIIHISGKVFYITSQLDCIKITQKFDRDHKLKFFIVIRVFHWNRPFVTLGSVFFVYVGVPLEPTQ